MADLSIRVKADFDEAHAALKKLAEESEDGALKLRNFGRAFSAEQAEKFIERQNVAAAAMQATGRETESLNSRIAAYQREIERLIKSGFDPQDEALQKLGSEYAGLLVKQDEALQKTKAEAAEAKAAAEAEKEKAAALEETAQKTVALLTASNDYERKSIELKQRQEELKDEMERLIKDGLAPESDEIKKLQKEYQGFTKEIQKNEAAHKAQEQAVKAACVALAAIGAAIAAGAGFAIKAAAANEDMIAAFVPLMNGDTEKATALFKAIQKEAAVTPFEIDKIAASVKALMPAFGGSAEKAMEAFRMLGDTAGGNAQKLETITSAYTKAMLKGKVSMQELNMIAGAGVPIYDRLASSMGVTVAEMMEMSKGGKITAADLTGAFQQMTGEGGIFFKGMETASDTFNMRLLGIKENAGILAGVIGEKLLPAAKDMAGAVLDSVQSFTDWIQEGDNFEKTAVAVATAVAAATAGLTAFVIASKGHAIVTAMSVAIKGLMSALAGPAGIAALATGALVAVIGTLVRKQNEQSMQAERIAGAYRDQKGKVDELISGYEKLNPQKAIDEKTTEELIRLYPELADKIEANVTQLEDLRRIQRQIEEDQVRRDVAPFIENLQQKYESYLDAVNKIKEAEENLRNDNTADAWTGSSAEQIYREAVWQYTPIIEQFKKIRADADRILANIGKEVDINNNFEWVDNLATQIESAEANALRAANEAAEQRRREAAAAREEERRRLAADAEAKKSLTQRLNEQIGYSDTQHLNERIGQVKSFLEQRADLEGVSGEERIEFYREQLEALKEIDTEYFNGKLAAEEALRETISDYREKMSDEEKEKERKRQEDLKKIATDAMEAFRQQMESIIPEEQRIQEERINAVQSFLQQRDKLEADDHAGRIAFLEKQKAELLAVETLTQDERVAIEKAADEAIAESRENLVKRERELLEQRIGAYTQLFSGISALVQAAGKENRAAVIFSRALAVAEAGINTAVAITRAWRELPYPAAIAATIGLAAQGAAQTIQIAATPIPTAETGGRFIVPDVSPRVDAGYMRFNGGEEVSVTPRGMAGNSGEFTVNVILDGQVLASFINKAARAGELYNLRMASNL